MGNKICTFKVRCIYGYASFTRGRVYKVENCRIKSDEGYSACGIFYSVDDLNNFWESKFVTYEKPRKMLSLCFIKLFIKLIRFQLKLVSKLIK